jgi:hypothetical protein
MGISNEERRQIAFERRNEFEAQQHARKVEAALAQFGPVLLHDGYEGLYKVRLNNNNTSARTLSQWLAIANNHYGTKAVLQFNKHGKLQKKDGWIFVRF